MSIEIIAGRPGAGKTYLMKKDIEGEINSRNIYVFQMGKEYCDLIKKYDGNYVKLASHIEINLFEFNPGKFSSREEYTQIYESHIQELMTFVLMLVGQDLLKREYKNILKSVLDELYESVGITNIGYNPTVQNSTSYLHFGILIDFLRKEDKEMANIFEQKISLINNDRNIAAIFQYEKDKPGDLTLDNRINVFDIDIKESKGVNVAAPIIYSFLINVKRNARLSESSKLMIVIDEGYWIWSKEEWQFLDSLKGILGDEGMDIKIKIVTQSISELGKRVPNLIKNAEQFIFFRQSLRDIDFLRTEFGLSEKEIVMCRGMETRQNFVVKKGYERKAAIKRVTRKVNFNTKKMSFEVKIHMLKLKYPKAGYYERMCLAGGYTKKQIDEMVRNALKDGWIENNGPVCREEVCETEVSCWE